MKRIGALLAGIALAGIALAGTVAVAPAATAHATASRTGVTSPGVSSHIETYKNVYNRRCLQPAMYWVSTEACTGGTQQKWVVQVWSDGTVRLQSYYNGFCLVESDGVGLDNCNTSEAQSWYVRRFSDGSIMLKNQNTGRCLRANLSDDVYTSVCNSDYKSERWI